MDMNLYEWMKGRKHHFPEAKVKNYVYQLMKALDHMHKNGVFHRDIKPDNIAAFAKPANPPVATDAGEANDSTVTATIAI